MTADPFLQDPGNLQSYNRYSYVLNNPLMYVDPSGYFSLKKVFKVVAVVAVAVVTYGAVSSALITSAANAAAASATLAANTGFAVAGFGMQAGALTTLGGAIAGAASGFAAGFVASGGNFESAFQGAFAGAIFGGVDAFYGGAGNYPFSRVIAQSAAGGVSSKLSGDSFSDGFKSSFGMSLLTYGNLQMREQMAEHARLNRDSDGSGLGVGFRGNYDKLAGGLYDSARPDAISQLGGRQGDPAYHFFGHHINTSTGLGRVAAVVMEAFGGPHDYFNSGFWYDGRGAIRQGMSNIERYFGELAINYSTSLVLAAPFAAAGLIPESAYGSLKHLKSKR